MCEIMEKLREEGVQEGIKEGRKEGTLNILYSQVNDGIISVSLASKYANMTEDEFLKNMKGRQ